MGPIKIGKICQIFKNVLYYEQEVKLILVEEEKKIGSEKQPLMNAFEDKESSFFTSKLLAVLLPKELTTEPE